MATNDLIQAECLFPADQDPRDFGYGLTFGAKFRFGNDDIYVNAKPEQNDLVRELQGLRQGVTYTLIEKGQGRKSGKAYYALANVPTTTDRLEEAAKATPPNGKEHSQKLPNGPRPQVTYELLRDTFFRIHQDVEQFFSDNDRFESTPESRQAAAATLFIGVQKERVFPSSVAPAKKPAEPKYESITKWLQETRTLDELTACYKAISEYTVGQGDDCEMTPEQQTALSSTIILQAIGMPGDLNKFKQVVSASKIKISTAMQDRLWPPEPVYEAPAQTEALEDSYDYDDDIPF